MADRRPSALAALVAGTIALASLAVGSVDAATPHERSAPGVTTWAGATYPASAGGGDIVPGSVGRSSPLLDATYDAYLRISWGTRKIYVDSTATIRNTSGAPIDRIELNTVAARLGSIQLHSVTVDGAPRPRRSATRRSSSRSAASCRSMA